MLACDMVMEVRASRCISREQVVQIESYVFGNGKPNFNDLDLMLVIDAYALRSDASWADLMSRAEAARDKGATMPSRPTARPLAA